MNNRIRIARTKSTTNLDGIPDSNTLMKGQPFYDTKTKRLFISSEDNKKINTLRNEDGITAYKISVPRHLKTQLDSTTDVTFDGSADQTAIPVIGVLPIANGGTGVADSDTESSITVKNVKSYINNIKIIDIFEPDGLAVKKATNALVDRTGTYHGFELNTHECILTDSAVIPSYSDSLITAGVASYAMDGDWVTLKTYDSTYSYDGFEIRIKTDNSDELSIILRPTIRNNN